jgi:hypothetical protein
MGLAVALLLGFVLLTGGVLLGASRFEARRRREGKWDQHGPLKPTSAEDSYPLKYSVLTGGLQRAWERFQRIRR